MNQNGVLLAATDYDDFPQIRVGSCMDGQATHCLVISIWHGFQYLYEFIWQQLPVVHCTASVTLVLFMVYLSPRRQS